MDASFFILYIAFPYFVSQILTAYGGGYKIDGQSQRVFENSSAHIKCDVLTNIPNDQALLVVWYKNNLPIYSYDTRATTTASHWTDTNIMGNRTVFRAGRREPAELIIKQVKAEDSGAYRCRVDFKLSPTRNSIINLEVVVPPQKPKILNERGEVIQSRVGPHEEGTDLVLVCVVVGGSPAPQVRWTSSKGTQLEGAMLDFSFQSALSNKLVIKNLSRLHQHAIYTCHASNFPKTDTSTDVTIELYLRPLSVDILLNNQPLSADRSYEIECQAIGSRPPSKITWWMSGIELTGHTQKVSENGNTTTSTLNYTPTREDNGKILICRATNELVKHGIKETAMKLNIYCDDVYWECKVHANPAAYKVVWKHNGQTVQHNPKAGIIASSSDLALQSVQIHQAGNYTCIASNVEGDGESNTVELKVMYRPMCRMDQKRIYGVARNEAAKIVCDVDSFPPPTSFKWSFNNTAETIDMPQSGFEKHSRSSSKLTYTPVKELDYGTIMCWADNAVGQQKDPCVFHIIAAGKPDAPYNCTLINQTSDGLEVDCNEGFDGGQRQWFIMEIYDQHTGMLQANLSSTQPAFTVSGLDANSLLKIAVFAANVKGSSDRVILEGFTLKAAEKQTGVHAQFVLTPVLSIGIFIGVLTAFVCIAFGTAMALKLHTAEQLRRRRLHQQHDSQFDKPFSTRPGNLPIKDKITLPVGGGDLDEICDDKNPDVVPCNDELDCKLKSAAQTPAAPHNNLHNNVSEFLGRSVNGTQMYYKTQRPANQQQQPQQQSSDELHYAELSLTRIYKSATANSMVSVNTINATATPTATATASTTGNHDIYENETLGTITTLPKIPPAYDYFNEPTVYAQIEHLKKMQHPPPTSPHPAASSSPAMTNSESATNSYQLHLQYDDNRYNNIGKMGNSAYGNTGMGPGLSNSGTNGTLSNSNTLTFSSMQSPSSATTFYQPNQAQSNTQQQQQQHTTTSSKPFSREIVTIRTPLLYTQQESCV